MGLEARCRALVTNGCEARRWYGEAVARLSRTPARYGPLAGVIDSDGYHGVVLPKGRPLEAAVNAALRTLIADGRISYSRSAGSQPTYRSSDRSLDTTAR